MTAALTDDAHRRGPALLARRGERLTVARLRRQHRRRARPRRRLLDAAASPSSRACSWRWPSAASASASSCGPRYFMPRRRRRRGARTRSRRPRRRSRRSATSSSGASTSSPAASLLVRMGGGRGGRARRRARSSRSARSGPGPGKGLKPTPFRRGVRLVTEDGDADPGRRPRRSTASSPCSPRATPTRPTRRPCSSGPSRPVAAPAGPRGLDRRRRSSPTRSSAPTSAARSGSTRPSEHLLLCPCHQSTFDVLDGARPVFGPAARSLPQLPLAIDDDGYLVATRRLLRPARRRASGTGTADGPPRSAPQARPHGHPAGRPLARRPARRRQVRPHARSTRSSPTTGRSCSASSPSTRFVVLLAHRRLPHVLLRPEHSRGRLRRQLRAAAGRRDDRGLPRRRSSSASTCGPGWSCARSTTGRRCCSSPPIVVHLVRVFFTGAFRRPRELNWMVGVHAADPGHLQRLRRLLAARRPALGHRPAHRLLDHAVDPGGRHVAGVAAVRRRVPRARHHQPALRDPHPAAAGAIIAVLLGAHLGPRRAPQAHAVPRAGPAREDNVVGERLWPTLRVQGDRACSSSPPRCSPLLGGAGPDQPDLALRPVRPGRGELGVASPTGTWAGSTARCGSCPAWEIRAFGFEIPNPFFPAVLLAGVTFGLLYAVAVPRGPVHRRPRASTTCSTGPATARCAPSLGVGDAHLLRGAHPRRASNDVIATTFGLSVNAVLVAFRVLPSCCPPIAAGRHLPALQRAPGPRHRQRHRAAGPAPHPQPSSSASGSGDGARHAAPATELTATDSSGRVGDLGARAQPRTRDCWTKPAMA